MLPFLLPEVFDHYNAWLSHGSAALQGCTYGKADIQKHLFLAYGTFLHTNQTVCGEPEPPPSGGIGIPVSGSLQAPQGSQTVKCGIMGLAVPIGI